MPHRTFAEDALDVFVRPILYLGIPTQQVDERQHGRGSGVESGGHEGDHVVLQNAHIQ